MSEEDIGNSTYHDRCCVLNSNPVLVARHFQCWVEVFFKEIAVDGPLGKTKYYAIQKETLVAEPLPENMPEEIKVLVLRKRNEIFDKVRDYINNFINPSKVNFYDPTCDDFIEVKSVSEVLEELNITEQEYENVLKISDDNSYQLHLRRSTDSCFANNYCDIGLLAWEANIDVQPIFDYL